MKTTPLFAASALKKTPSGIFDSDGAEVIRNLTSVGIRLERCVKNGRLKMISARTIIGSAETLLVRIKSLAIEHGTRCLVIDPVSSLSTAGNELTAHGVVDRLIDSATNDVAEVEGKLRRVTLAAEEGELQVRLKSLQTELVAKQVEKTLLARTTASHKGQITKGRRRLRQLRGGDLNTPEPR
jgi:hypothetical protein